MDVMFINEIFYSLQGEGLLAGVPSVFIRLAGCPLGCKWCDTKYAWPPNAGDDLTVSEIIDRIKKWNCKRIVLTGGEPMFNPQLPRLAKTLKKKGKHITIETAGVAYIPGLACDLMSISPKTSNAGTKSAPNTKIISRLISRYPYQLKFVVDSPDDLPEIQKFVKSLGKVDLTRIMLMPQARTRKELLAKSPLVAQMCENTGYAFCQRLQIFLYNARHAK
jgi:7-carboxy-7-deazaguanine synthase